MKEYSLVARGLAIAAGVIILAVIGPLLWGLAMAGVSILVLLAVGAAIIGFFQALPFLGQVLENRLLLARKNEARKNPIEELQRILMTKRTQVSQFKSAVASIIAQVNSLKAMVEERKRSKPGYDPTKQLETIREMQKAVDVLTAKYQAAERALEEFADKIDEQSFDWKFAQAGKQAVAALSGTSGEDLLNNLLGTEAFSSIRDNFNQVFADLELEAVKINGSHQLQLENGAYLDVSGVNMSAFQLQPQPR